MNKKAQKSLFGMALLLVFFVIAIVLFATIDPLKEQLDNNRGASTLNCPNTPDFNQADYANDTQFEKLVRRPTCFVTGISMVWFVGAVLIMSAVWVFRNWGKLK